MRNARHAAMGTQKGAARGTDWAGLQLTLIRSPCSGCGVQGRAEGVRMKNGKLEGARRTRWCEWEGCGTIPKLYLRERRAHRPHYSHACGSRPTVFNRFETGLERPQAQGTRRGDVESIRIGGGMRRWHHRIQASCGGLSGKRASRFPPPAFAMAQGGANSQRSGDTMRKGTNMWRTIDDSLVHLPIHTALGLQSKHRAKSIRLKRREAESAWLSARSRRT